MRIEGELSIYLHQRAIYDWESRSYVNLKTKEKPCKDIQFSTTKDKVCCTRAKMSTDNYKRLALNFEATMPLACNSTDKKNARKDNNFT